MARAKISQVVPICKPRPEVHEVITHLCDLEDLTTHLKRGVTVLDFFNEDYVDDSRELYNINSALAQVLGKLVGKMEGTICQARRAQHRLLEGDR